MGKFVIKKTPTGFNFSLFAVNKEKIAVASQVYTTKASCKNALDSIAKFANKAVEEDRIEDNSLQKPVPKTNPKFEIYLDKQGLFRWRLFASNGESIAMAEEGYKSKDGCKNGIRSVAVNALNAELVDETVAK